MALTILATYPQDIDERTAYQLTREPNVKKMIEAAGSILNPEAFVLYEDADAKSGEIKKVLTIKCDNEIFGTISSTFINAFMDAADYFKGTPGPIEIVTGETKNGREYVTCKIV